MEKQERMVVHLEFNGEHFYFGSMKAIFEKFKSKELGISYNYLKNYGLSDGKSYTNQKCTIRKGVLITIEKGKEKD
jgi:hypothetical protein